MRLHLLTRVDLTGESVHHLREAREADVYFDSVYEHAVKLEKYIESLPDHVSLNEELTSLEQAHDQLQREADDIADELSAELKKSKLDKNALNAVLSKLRALL